MNKSEALAIVSEVGKDWRDVQVQIIDRFAHRQQAGYRLCFTRRSRVLSVRYVEDWEALKAMWQSEQPG
jgi:hypothetical protein